MNKFELAINTGFAVNRYSEPEEWVKIIGSDLQLRRAQMTADILNPSLSDKIVTEYVGRTLKSCKEHNVKVTSTFTGGFTRVNHLAHPNKEVQRFWVDWFKRFVDITVELGAEAMGSHFGIFTAADDADKKRREERRQENIANWHEIGKYAKKKGLKFLSWEPMSISREQGETISETVRLHNDVNKNAPIEFKICLDVDHGDVSSTNPDDTDPYAWLAKFAKESPQIHLKQSLQSKSGHFPFTREFNEIGKIKPDKVLQTLRNNGSNAAELIFEHSFRERQPADSTVVEVLKECVAYWKPAM